MITILYAIILAVAGWQLYKLYYRIHRLEVNMDALLSAIERILRNTRPPSDDKK
jgi:hypothetical protein